MHPHMWQLIQHSKPSTANMLEPSQALFLNQHVPVHSKAGSISLSLYILTHNRSFQSWIFPGKQLQPYRQLKALKPKQTCIWHTTNKHKKLATAWTNTNVHNSSLASSLLLHTTWKLGAMGWPIFTTHTELSHWMKKTYHTNSSDYATNDLP